MLACLGLMSHLSPLQGVFLWEFALCPCHAWLSQERSPLLHLIDGCHAQVTVDNSTASSYSSFIIACPNRKGLLYDIFRTFTDVQVRVAYGKVAVKPPNNFEAELFVQEVDGARILDP